MHFVTLLGAAALLTSMVGAAPQEQVKRMEHHKGASKNHHLGDHNKFVNYIGKRTENHHPHQPHHPHHGSHPQPPPNSCETPSASTVFVTVDVTTTVTKHHTKHGHHPTVYPDRPHTSSALAHFTNSSSSFTMPLSTGTGFSTGFPTSSALTSVLYTNITRTMPLGTGFSTGFPSSSPLTSVLYPNTTTIVNSTVTRTVSVSSLSSPTSTMRFMPVTTTYTTTDFESSTSSTSSTQSITVTLSGPSVPAGTPPAAARLCDVRGLPLGDNFLGQLVNSRAGVDVTIQGCYRFCASGFGTEMGCLSFSYYPEPGLGTPRCDLYGASVAQSLDEIIPQVPNRWYDIACSEPTS